MANETPAPVTPTAAVDQRNPKSVANSIMNNIQNKANGTKPTPAGPENGKDPVAAPADPNAGKEKYTVDGKDVWLSPDQARAYVQKGIAFEPKVTQLGHLQHEVATLLRDLQDPSNAIKKLKYTPKAVLEAALKSGDVGDDVKEFLGQWYYQNVIEPMKLTPEQLKAREDAKWREKKEAEESSAKDLAIKQENQRRVDLAMTQLKSQIGEAMQESGLPNNDSPLGVMLARRVADVMRLGYFQKQAITPKDAIARVKAEMKQVQAAYYDHLDEETLVKELGEKNAEKVKKYFLKIVKDAEKKIPSNGISPRSTRPGERKVISPDDMKEYLEELKRGG